MLTNELIFIKMDLNHYNSIEIDDLPPCENLMDFLHVFSWDLTHWMLFPWTWDLLLDDYLMDDFDENRWDYFENSWWFELDLAMT